MRQLSISLFLLLFVSIVPSQADDLDKGRKALVKLEKNANATAADQKSVVDMLKAVTEKSTDKGDVCYAYLLLGEAYSEYVPSSIRDYKEAAKYYQKAGELLPTAYPDDAKEKLNIKNRKGAIYYNIGYYTYYKNSPTQDFAKALEYFLKAAKYNPYFYRSVGEMYEFGLGCDINPTTAIAYYTKTNSNGGDSYAKYYSTEYFIKQITTGGTLDTLAYNSFRDGMLFAKMGEERPDMEKMKQLLTTAAERGYLPAQFELGTNYRNGTFPGNSKEENDKQAELWLKKAADANYVPAVYQLGFHYENLYKTPKNLFPKEGFQKAVPYYERAAEADFPYAQGALAYCYINTLGGLPKDWNAAEYLYECAACKGYTLAETNLTYINAQKQSMKSGLGAALLGKAFGSMGTVGKVLSYIVKTQSKLTPDQTTGVHRLSYKEGKVVSDVGQTSEYAEVINDGQVYGDYERKMIDMCYGLLTYDSQQRKDYQEAMRQIREKWEAKDLWIYKQSKWEKWGGVCKVSKK